MATWTEEPELLPSSQLEDDFELMTPSFPPLDDSKQRALRQVFTHPTSCILGPPGTGKSQAICALIDEFLMRHPNRPLKILVSASSYEPMRVVLDKLQSHRDHEGSPTLAAQIEKVWLHSSTRANGARRGSPLARVVFSFRHMPSTSRGLYTPPWT